MSKDGVEVVYDLYSNQEETDSRVVFYAMYAASKGYQYVRVKTRDSDPIVLTIPDPPPLHTDTSSLQNVYSCIQSCCQTSGNIRLLFTCQLFQSKQSVQYMNQFVPDCGVTCKELWNLFDSGEI